MADVRTELIEGRIVLPSVGEVVVGDRASLPYLVVDAAGQEVEPTSHFLRELTLGDRSALTVKSYAHDLLRWWRLLHRLGVSWDRATTEEVTVLVGWQRNQALTLQPAQMGLLRQFAP